MKEAHAYTGPMEIPPANDAAGRYDAVRSGGILPHG